MSSEGRKTASGVTIQTRARTNSTDSSSAPSVRTPRAARFAEATAVHSPIEPSEASKSPFAKLSSTDKSKPQQAAQPSDVGFGYISQNDGASHIRNTLMVDDARNMPPSTPKSPLKSPLKSALKSPGAPPRVIENPLSPTFKEEEHLEKQEKATEKTQARDLVSSHPQQLECFNKVSSDTNSSTETKDSSAHGKGVPARHQFQLQSDRTRYGSNDLFHLQRDKGPPCA